MCAPTSDDRQVGEVLHEADHALGQLDRDQHGRGPRGAGRRVDRAQREPAAPRRGRSAGRPGRRAAGEIASGSRPVRAAPCVAGVRAAAGDQVPTTSTARSTAGDPGERAQRGGHRRRRRRRRLAGAPPERVRGRDHRHRRRKCSPTTHGLRSVSTVMPPSTACAGMPSSTADGQRQQPAPARAGAASAASTHGQRDQRRPTKVSSAVAELDDPVDAHRGGRDVGLVGAAGPGRAAEAGAGQPDGAAGDHDHDVGDDEASARRRAGGGEGNGRMLRERSYAP